MTDRVTQPMEYRPLGRSGCAVSVVALGTMTFGAESSEEVSHAQLDRFVEVGGTLIDTADVYSNGVSESIIGRWLARQPADVRDELVLATKGRFPLGDGPNAAGLSRKHLADALDASLRRLGVDPVDLYQVHAYDPITPLDETLRFLDDAVRAGKIHYAGLSNFTGWQTQRAVDVAERLGLGTARCRCSRSTTCWPGRSSGRWCPRPSPTGSACCPGPRSAGGGSPASTPGRSGPPVRPGSARTRSAASRRTTAASSVERTWDVVDAVRTMAAARGISMAQIALAWLVDRPGMTSVILGARTLEQLEDNLGAVGLHLTAAEIAALDTVSDPSVGDYPYGGPGQDQRSRTI